MDIIHKYKAWLFDGDGVLYQGKNPIFEAVNFLNYLRTKNIPTYLLTNNSTASMDEYEKKMKDIGIEFDKIYTSAYTTVSLLDVQTAFIIGENGIFDACEKSGIRTELDKNEIPDVVIVGMDRKLTYDKLHQGIWYILQGSRYVATNPDKTFPLKDSIAPGAGSMIAAVNACVNKLPEFIAGKPEKYIFEKILDEMDLNTSDVIMVGDRYETDILGATKLGIDTILVRTGIAARYDEKKLEQIKDSSYPPTYIVNSLQELMM